jgi:hypothetical protein
LYSKKGQPNQTKGQPNQTKGQPNLRTSKEMNSEWVDQLLSFHYYGYALTEENIDEFEYNGLFVERYAWVDRKLEKMYKIKTNEETDFDDFDEDLLLRPTPITWCNYRSGAVLDCIEDDSSRRRCESDISDYEEEVERAISSVNDICCDSSCFEYSDSESEYSSLNDYDYDFGYDSF